MKVCDLCKKEIKKTMFGIDDCFVISTRGWFDTYKNHAEICNDCFSNIICGKR